MKNAHFVCVFLCPNTRRTPLNTAPPPAPPVSPTAEQTEHKSPIATLLFPAKVHYSLWGHRSALALGIVHSLCHFAFGAAPPTEYPKISYCTFALGTQRASPCEAAAKASQWRLTSLTDKVKTLARLRKSASVDLRTPNLLKF